jgi:hypothetical protein
MRRARRQRMRPGISWIDETRLRQCGSAGVGDLASARRPCCFHGHGNIRSLSRRGLPKPLRRQGAQPEEAQGEERRVEIALATNYKVRVISRKLFVQRGWLGGSYALRRSAGRTFRSPLVSDTQVWTANRDWRFSNEAPACRWLPAPLLPRGVPRARSPRYCPSPSTDRATGAAGAVEQKRSRRVPGAARVGAAGEGRCPHPTGHSSFTSASFVLDGAIVRRQP